MVSGEISRRSSKLPVGNYTPHCAEQRATSSISLLRWPARRQLAGENKDITPNIPRTQTAITPQKSTLVLNKTNSENVRTREGSLYQCNIAVNIRADTWSHAYTRVYECAGTCRSQDCNISIICDNRSPVSIYTSGTNPTINLLH